MIDETARAMTRPEFIEHFVSRIAGVIRDHPVRVGIDGVDGVGKTTLAGGIDACCFDKANSEGTVAFSFPIGRMTGYHPAQFDDLPERFRYLHRELVTTESGLRGALYCTLEGEHDGDASAATFVIEKADRRGFHEVVWVTYEAAQQSHVMEVLSTITYSARDR